MTILTIIVLVLLILVFPVCVLIKVAKDEADMINRIREMTREIAKENKRWRE